MENKQTLIAVVLFMTVLVGMAVLAYLYGGGVSQRRADFRTTKRFTAKPGTTRENAMALSSSKRPAQKATAPPKPTGRPPIPVKSLSPPDEEMSNEEQALRAAVNSLDPDTGITKIDRQLGLPQRSDHAARLHAARAKLALQKDPPDYASAAKDLALAADMAPTAAVRYEYLALDAAALLRQEAYAEAATRVSAELAEPGPLSPGRIRLRAMLAQAQELRGEPAAAEAAYRQVLRDAVTYSPEPDPATDDLLRLAALRLSEILRESGREDEARDLARGLRARLRGDAEEPAAQSGWTASATR